MSEFIFIKYSIQIGLFFIKLIKILSHLIIEIVK